MYKLSYIITGIIPITCLQKNRIYYERTLIPFLDKINMIAVTSFVSTQKQKYSYIKISQMKKTTIAAAFLMAISTLTFAGNDKDKAKGESTATIINSTKENVYKLHYNSATPGTVAVNILDASGKVILIDYIKNKEGFVRPYNFQGLSEGNYFIEVNDHAGKVKIPLTHKSEQISNFIKADVKALSSDRKFELLMLGNLSKGVVVTIYNKFDKIIYSESITETSGIRKVYNLSKVGDREITFEVKAQNKVIHTERF